MGFITKLGYFVLILAIIYLFFFGETTFYDYPAYYSLFLLGFVLLVIGLFKKSPPNIPDIHSNVYRR